MQHRLCDSTFTFIHIKFCYVVEELDVFEDAELLAAETRSTFKTGFWVCCRGGSRTSRSLFRCNFERSYIHIVDVLCYSGFFVGVVRLQKLNKIKAFCAKRQRFGVWCQHASRTGLGQVLVLLSSCKLWFLSHEDYPTVKMLIKA